MADPFEVPDAEHLASVREHGAAVRPADVAEFITGVTR